MTGTLTAQNISHKRCVAFVRTDRFCSTSCAGILVRPVLRSFRPKATPRAIYRYSLAARSKVYALGGVESAQCCPTNGAAEKTSSADVKMRRRKHIGGCLGLKLYIRSDEWRRVVDATSYAIPPIRCILQTCEPNQHIYCLFPPQYRSGQNHPAPPVFGPAQSGRRKSRWNRNRQYSACRARQADPPPFL